MGSDPYADWALVVVFHGGPDLHAWLVDRKTAGIVVCGITTNHCCETTARVGGNLGHEVLFALDATYTVRSDRAGRAHAHRRRARPSDGHQPAR